MTPYHAPNAAGAPLARKGNGGTSHPRFRAHSRAARDRLRVRSHRSRPLPRRSRGVGAGARSDPPGGASGTRGRAGLTRRRHDRDGRGRCLRARGPARRRRVRGGHAAPVQPDGRGAPSDRRAGAHVRDRGRGEPVSRVAERARPGHDREGCAERRPRRAGRRNRLRTRAEPLLPQRDPDLPRGVESGSRGDDAPGGRPGRPRLSRPRARVPARRGGVMPDLDAFGTIADGLDHPEGVAVGPDGTIYAGGEAGQIYRIAEDGSVDQLASTEGFIYGVTIDAGGNVYACDFGNASVMRVSAAGEVSTYSTGTSERPMRVPNFSAFDDAGNLYVTDSGEWGADDGLVYRIAPGGDTAVWTDRAPRFPNGCCLSGDGDALVVVESHGRAVVRVPIRDDGSSAEPEPIVDLTGSQPDGIALAE